MIRTLSYCGLLDDFSIRHRDGPTIDTLAQLNGHLIATALFGDPILLNDGYLIFNQSLVDAIASPMESPLLELLQCGFVQILTRNQGQLATLASFMAEQGITNAVRLVEDPHFGMLQLPSLIELEERLASQAYNPFRSWPQIHVGHVFRQVSKNALDSLVESGDDTGEYGRFAASVGERIGSRTGWEDAARELRSAGALSDGAFASVMAAANEAYQYSWGCLLAAPMEQIRVQTRLPRFLASLDHSEGEVTPETPMMPTVNVPDFTHQRHKRTEAWVRLAEICSYGSPSNVVKRTFLSALDRHLLAGSETSRKELHDASRDYSLVLKRSFAPEISKYVDFAFLVVPIAVSGLVAGPVGVAVSAVISAGGFIGAEVNAWNRLLWRMGLPSTNKWARLVQSASPSRSESWFQLDHERASSFVAGAPPFVAP